MTQRILRRRITLVNLARHHAPDIRQRKQNAQRCGAFPVWRAVRGQPGDVAAGTEETCGGDEVGREVLHARADGGEEDSVACYAEGCHEDEREEPRLVPV